MSLLGGCWRVFTLRYVPLERTVIGTRRVKTGLWARLFTSWEAHNGGDAVRVRAAWSATGDLGCRKGIEASDTEL